MITDELKQRIIGAFYFLPIIIGTLLGQPYMGVAIGCLQALMCYELGKILAESKGYSARTTVMLTALFLLTALSTRFDVLGLSPFALAAFLSLVTFVIVLITWRFFAALFTVAVIQCLSSLSLLVSVPSAEFLLIALALIIAAVDIGAYFGGRAIGGRKLAPSISPGKTISGGISGLVAGIIMAVIIALFGGFMSGNVILMASVIAILVQAGDLYESAFKRRMNIKDSSNIIPGHGGFLDRFDGYIFIIPLIVALLATTSS